MMYPDYAQVAEIKFGGLLRKNEEEAARLLTVCTHSGIFYLPIGEGQSDRKRATQELFHLGELFFGMSVEMKLQFDMEKRNSYYG